MKIISKNLFLLFLIFLFGMISSVAQGEPENNQVLEIKVNFYCINGKKLLEARLADLDGVVDANANLEKRVVTVFYNIKEISKQEILDFIENIGFLTEYSDINKKIINGCGHDHNH
jgi:hypothetical protein